MDSQQPIFSSVPPISSSASSSPSTSSAKAATPDLGLTSLMADTAVPSEVNNNINPSVSSAVSAISSALTQPATVSVNNNTTSVEQIASTSTLSASAAPYSSLYTITPPTCRGSIESSFTPSLNNSGCGNMAQQLQYSQSLPSRGVELPLPPSLDHSITHQHLLGQHQNNAAALPHSSAKLTPLPIGNIGGLQSGLTQHQLNNLANATLLHSGVNGPASGGISVNTTASTSSHTSNQSYSLDTTQGLIQQLQQQQLLGSAAREAFQLQRNPGHTIDGQNQHETVYNNNQNLLQHQNLDILSQKAHLDRALSSVTVGAGAGGPITPTTYHHPLLHQPLPQGFNLEEFVATYLEPLPEGHISLYISQLSYFCSEKELSELLAPYGPILALTVRKGIYGTTLMHGFALLSNTDVGLGGAEARARRAVAELDGQEFMGRNVRVALTSEATIRATAIGGNIYSTPGGNIVGLGGPDLPPSKSAQIHVSFLAKRSKYLVTEKLLRDIFSTFGPIADISIKKHNYTENNQRQAGYGFIYYFERSRAAAAIESMKNRAIHNISFDCSFCHGGSAPVGGPQPNGLINTALPQAGMPGALGYGAGAQIHPRGYPQSHESIPATLPVSVTSAATQRLNAPIPYQSHGLPASINYPRGQHAQVSQLYGQHLSHLSQLGGLAQQSPSLQRQLNHQQLLNQQQQQHLLYGAAALPGSAASLSVGTRTGSVGQQINSGALGVMKHTVPSGFSQQAHHLSHGIPQTLPQTLSHQHHNLQQGQQMMSEDDFLAKYLSSSLHLQQIPSDLGALGSLPLSGSELDDHLHHYPHF